MRRTSEGAVARPNGEGLSQVDEWFVTCVDCGLRGCTRSSQPLQRLVAPVGPAAMRRRAFVPGRSWGREPLGLMSGQSKIVPPFRTKLAGCYGRCWGGCWGWVWCWGAGCWLALGGHPHLHWLQVPLRSPSVEPVVPVQSVSPSRPVGECVTDSSTAPTPSPPLPPVAPPPRAAHTARAAHFSPLVPPSLPPSAHFRKPLPLSPPPTPTITTTSTPTTTRTDHLHTSAPTHHRLRPLQHASIPDSTWRSRPSYPNPTVDIFP